MFAIGSNLFSLFVNFYRRAGKSERGDTTGEKSHPVHNHELDGLAGNYSLRFQHK